MDIREIMILNINTHISGRQAGEQYSHTLLQALQNVMEPQSFSNLYITHIEIVVDVVQKRDAFLNNFLELFHSIIYCILLNQHYIGKVKSDFLKLWLKSEEN